MCSDRHPDIDLFFISINEIRPISQRPSPADQNIQFRAGRGSCLLILRWFTMIEKRTPRLTGDEGGREMKLTNGRRSITVVVCWRLEPNLFTINKFLQETTMPRSYLPAIYHPHMYSSTVAAPRGNAVHQCSGVETQPDKFYPSAPSLYQSLLATAQLTVVIRLCTRVARASWRTGQGACPIPTHRPGLEEIEIKLFHPSQLEEIYDQNTSLLVVFVRDAHRARAMHLISISGAWR